MRLKDINVKGIKPLHNLIAYRWIKTDSFDKANIIIPDSINDGGGEDRMGHKYTCEVIAVGPKVAELKVGDWFFMHEYNKLDQGTPWNVDDLMFVEEEHILFKFPNKTKKLFNQAPVITEKMEAEYEDL